MSRTELIKQIKKLSEEDVARLAAYLDGLTEGAEYRAAMLAAVKRGQESARRGRLVSTEEVMAKLAANRRARAKRK